MKTIEKIKIYFENRKAAKKLKRKKDLDDWLMEGEAMVMNHCPDSLWLFIKDSIYYRECDISHGGFRDCYIKIILDDYKELRSVRFHRIDALNDILTQIYHLKLEGINA